MYVWQEGNPVQLAKNLTLPGGFKLGAFGSQYCDVATATGLKVTLFLVQYRVQYSTVQYSIVQYNTVQYSTVQ